MANTRSQVLPVEFHGILFLWLPFFNIFPAFLTKSFSLFSFAVHEEFSLLFSPTDLKEEQLKHPTRNDLFMTEVIAYTSERVRVWERKRYK